MTKIYNQHDAAFAQVSAYALLDSDNNHIGKVAFKFPKDGAGRLYCYFHIHGLEMVRGFAGGYGYDKSSAAFQDAARKKLESTQNEWISADTFAKHMANANKIAEACKAGEGKDWSDALRDAGYTLLRVL